MVYNKFMAFYFFNYINFDFLISFTIFALS